MSFDLATNMAIIEKIKVFPEGIGPRKVYEILAEETTYSEKEIASALQWGLDSGEVKLGRGMELVPTNPTQALMKF